MALKKIEIESFRRFRYVSSPTFSPDGRDAAFLVRDVRGDLQGYDCNLFVLHVADRSVRQLTHEGDVTSFVWTQEGKLLLPLSRDAAKRERVADGEELTSLYELDPATGAISPAFDLPLERADVHPLMQDTYLIYARKDRNRPDFAKLPKAQRRAAYEAYRDPPYHVLTDAPFWENGGTFTSGVRDQMFLFDRPTGRLTQITEPEFTAMDPRDGARPFTLRGTKIIYKGMYWNGGLRPTWPGVYLYDYATGERRTLLPDDAASTSFICFWADDELLLGYTDHPEHMEHIDEFHTLDLNTGEIKLLAHCERLVSFLSVTTDAKLGGGKGSMLHDGKFYYAASIGDYSYVCSVDRQGKVDERLSPDGGLSAFDLSGEHMLLCGMYGGKINELYLDGEQVTHFNDFLPEEYSIAQPQFFTFQADSDGTEVHGWVMEPVGYEPGKQYPAILFIHGGPKTIFSDVFHHEMQVWANAGYFVLFSNPRGSDGRGLEFLNICGHYGETDYTDIMQFTDEALRRYPDIDPSRVGVCGGSYGGYMTNWIIGHTDRFAAAVSQRSIASWSTQEHLSDIGPNYTVYEQDAQTCTDAKSLWEHSPLAFAQNCKTPTLFLHSDRDYRCPVEEGLSMYTALSMAGCPTKLILFHGENHELSRSGKPYNRISRMKEILAWFDSYLRPAHTD